MTELGEASLFMVTATAHIILILFALLRLKTAPAVAPDEKVSFQSIPLARVSTPETAALSADQDELTADRSQAANPIDNKQMNQGTD
ncbi:hypothetical protein [Yoonia algicola]|uniref:Uncharacterized protein n=1 Tax=Yoonia algicola TaxID=3137368 RepID=A0AAN0M384_9RHOB